MDRNYREILFHACHEPYGFHMNMQIHNENSVRAACLSIPMEFHEFNEKRDEKNWMEKYEIA